MDKKYRKYVGKRRFEGECDYLIGRKVTVSPGLIMTGIFNKIDLEIGLAHDILGRNVFLGTYPFIRLFIG